MTSSKKFLMVSLVTSFIYIALGVALLLINNMDTISMSLATAIVIVAMFSCTLCWKIMHDENVKNRRYLSENL